MSLRLRARIAHYTGSGPDHGFTYHPDGVVHAERGRIVFAGAAADYDRAGFNLSDCEHLPQHLLLAGFVDAHVHSPQLQMVGSFGEQLLEWLTRYTFPAEMAEADPALAEAHAEWFLDELLSNGVTSAMVFASSFAHSADALFRGAQARGMRLLTGKVWMDRHAPAGLVDTADSAAADSRALIERWHGVDRLGYAITPRFAGTSTREQLQRAGAMLTERPDLWMQTHLSESRAELSWTASLYPEAKDYLDVYERAGLHHPKSVFAHCLHLSGSECERIRATGSAMAFCPSSNLFLGSGLFDYEHHRALRIPMALASDVGAGTSLSPFRTLGDAYKVCQLRGYSLNAREAYYLASLGAARALKLDREIGHLQPGATADLVVLSGDAHPFIKARLAKSASIDEELFVYMTTGDDRLVARTYIAGRLRYRR